jgi:hypothetical protein
LGRFLILAVELYAMSLSCVEDLLREMANKMNEFLIRVNNFERSFQAEDKVGRYIFTLALLNYLLNRCTPFRVTHVLDVVTFNCNGRYLGIETGSWTTSKDDPYVGSKIKRNVFANTLFKYYTQATSKLPKEDYVLTDEEKKFLEHLSKVNTIIIGEATAINPTELLYIVQVLYRTTPIEVLVDNEHKLKEPTISIVPNGSKPKVDEVTFMADITIPEANRTPPLEIPYHATFYSSSEEIRETTYSGYEKYVWVGRQGACLVKNRLLDEFNRLMDLFNGAFSFALTYLLY